MREKLNQWLLALEAKLSEKQKLRLLLTLYCLLLMLCGLLVLKTYQSVPRLV